MIVVIIAGGSGTRLWPLSTPSYPKHLLKINGNDKSLVQMTYERAKAIASDIYVLTEASHAHHVQEQISDLSENNFIIEPARRGTASCIIAALETIQKNHATDEPIAFLSADHYVRDVEGFAHSFKVAGEVSKREGRIVLVGIEPDHPATGFGYIQKDGLYDEESFVFEVHSFKEKPDYETAKSYIATGKYLWNSGYFVGSVDTFKKAMDVCAPELAKNLNELAAAGDNYESIYLGFDNNTIDYALIEHVKDLLVVPASFDWMDLGSFGDMHKAAGADENGNHAKGDVELEGVENSFVQNHDDSKPVAVIGLDNVVVINTKDGILIARKDLSQKVGEVSKRISGRKV